MKLEQILENWKEDCVIGRDLTESSLRTPILHAKYMKLYVEAKGRKIYFDMEQKKILKKKWEYYNGSMTQEEMDKEGWEYDPFKGTKVLKGDMSYYYDSDPEIQKSEAKIQHEKLVIDTLKEILENLKWRHQNIRNMIEWQKFEAGG